MTKEELIEFGKDLKRRREALDLTQAQLGAEMDASGNTVWRWETAQSEPEHPAMLDKAIKWLELSKALSDDPWFDTAEAKLAQMEAKLEAGRARLRVELGETIARIERDSERAAEMADDLAAMKADLAEISQ